VKVLNSEATCDGVCLPRQELFFIKNHNDVVLVHKSSLLGKHELPEDLNIQVLPFLFEDHQNDMDDMHKFVCIRLISI